jgi:hypothetical protein
VVDVGDKAGEYPHYWPFDRSQMARFLRLQVAVVQDEKAENKEQLYEQQQRIHVWREMDQTTRCGMVLFILHVAARKGQEF